LVQTLFYGVFSAWVLWSKQHPPTSKERFDWYTTGRYLRVPMIFKLFHLVADPQALEALKLTEVLDWAVLVLNRVDRRSFFDRFQESHAVQYFYAPFLEAFDPELRKELGVWYTPPEIAKYMVGNGASACCWFRVRMNAEDKNWHVDVGNSALLEVPSAMLEIGDAC